MDNSPSFTLCFSPEDIDDHSELTESCCDDVYDLSQEDDFGIKRAADPYYYHTLDGSRSSRNGNEELAEIRMHLVRKQETIDILSSKLSQCEADIEVLKAERAALVNELAAPSVETRPPRGRSSKDGDDGNGGGGSPRDANAKLVAENARLQVALDVLRQTFQSYVKDRRTVSAEDGRAISDLQRENELLRQRLGLASTRSPVAPTIPSKPQGQRTVPAHPSNPSDFTKPGIFSQGRRASLSGSERTASTCPLDVSDITKRGPLLSQGRRASLSGSERTAGICPLDASDVTLPQLGVSLSSLRSMALSECESEDSEAHPTSGSNESTEEVKDGSASARVPRLPDGESKNTHPSVEARSEDGESTAASDSEAQFSKDSGELVVGFGEARRTKAALKRRSSLPDEAARHNSGGLLVDFGVARRPKRTPERAQSFIIREPQLRPKRTPERAQSFIVREPQLNS